MVRVAAVSSWVAVAALAVAALSLAFPYYEEQVCPPMRECGPWQERSGWEAGGWPLPVALGLAALALAVGWRSRAGHGVALAACLAFLVGLMMTQFAWQFAVFTDLHGPWAAYYLGLAGGLMATMALVVSLTQDLRAGSTPQLMSPPDKSDEA